MRCCFCRPKHLMMSDSIAGERMGPTTGCICYIWEIIRVTNYQPRAGPNTFLRFLSRLPPAGWKITSLYEVFPLTTQMKNKTSVAGAIVMHLKQQWAMSQRSHKGVPTLSLQNYSTMNKSWSLCWLSFLQVENKGLELLLLWDHSGRVSLSEINELTSIIN